MTEAQAIEAILQHWEDGWEALHPADTSDPDHVPWTPDDETFEAVASWVRITIVPTTAAQGSLGATPRWIRRGQIAVQIFTTPNEGAAAGALLADDVRTVLEGKRIALDGDDEPVCTYAGASQPLGNDGAWRSAVVVIPYRFDQHR